jgi:deoxyribose-phosphate aldolase
MPLITDRYEDVARSIDHALLNPALTDRELEAGCRLAVHYGVASVCVVPHFLSRAVDLVQGSPVLASTTVGFPHGGQATAVKLVEAAHAIDDGAEELDVVVNISKVKSGDFEYVRSELGALARAVHQRGKKIKVIFENSYLDEGEKIELCRISGEIGADWAKTSTGFSSAGATQEDVALMRSRCPPEVQIKASGGIHDLDTLLALRALGATRVGTSRTRDILEQFRLLHAPRS